MSFAKPSEAPASDGWKFSVEENIGGLFVIEPKEEGEIENQFGPGMSKYIEADVTEIDLDNVEESETHESVWIFPAWIQGSIRHAIADGGMVLGRLQQDADKGRGNNAAWVLEDADDEDIEAATAWLNQRNRSKLGSASGSSDDEGKKKKKKK